MIASNTQIADMFGEIADLLELKQDNPFRVRAYRNAARLIERLPRQVWEMVAAGENLSSMRGIGKDLASKMTELATTGRLDFYERLKKGPDGKLIQLLHVPDLGPKRARILHEELGINSLKDLEAAARKGLLAYIPGFGNTLEAKILNHVGLEKKVRLSWSSADRLAGKLLQHMKKTHGLQKMEIAGSYRRHAAEVGDLDLLAAAMNSEQVMKRFLDFDERAETTAIGPTRASMRLKNGFQIDLRVVSPDSFGAALAYFTGSKAHNIHLRALAKRRGLKLNEYGLYRGRQRLAGKTEQEIFTALELAWIDPTWRENRGEIEKAATQYRRKKG